MPSIRPSQSLLSLLLLLGIILISLHLRTSRAQNMQANCSVDTPDDCRSDEWFDMETGCCNTCTVCSEESERFAFTQCNKTHDAVCDCNKPFFLDTRVNLCLFECSFCPTGECLPGSSTACMCEDQSCHTSDDPYCRRPRCKVEPTMEADTPRPPPSTTTDNVFPPWGIGLIAVGIVIGIIIFAACFLCLGLFTVHKTRDPESPQGSEASENGLVSRESLGSIGTNSTYTSSTMYPYLSSHSMLELLKHSNSHMVCPNERLSSLQNSPVSARSSPKPGRTVKLTKCTDSNKLTAIML